MNDDFTSLKRKIKNIQLLAKVENFNINQQLDNLLDKQKVAQDKKQNLCKTLTEMEQFEQAHLSSKNSTDFFPELHSAVNNYFGKLTAEKIIKEQQLTEAEEVVTLQTFVVAKCRKKALSLQGNITAFQKKQQFLINKMEDQQLTELSNQRKLLNQREYC